MKWIPIFLLLVIILRLFAPLHCLTSRFLKCCCTTMIPKQQLTHDQHQKEPAALMVNSAWLLNDWEGSLRNPGKVADARAEMEVLTEDSERCIDIACHTLLRVKLPRSSGESINNQTAFFEDPVCCPRAEHPTWPFAGGQLTQQEENKVYHFQLQLWFFLLSSLIFLVDKFFVR